MDSRKLEEVKALKVSLDKALSKEPVQNEERIFDLLRSLHDIEMNPTILRTCDLRSTLKEIKKLFGESRLGSEVKKIVIKWKDECQTVTVTTKNTSDSSNPESRTDKKATTTSKTSPPKPSHTPPPQAPITATNMSLLTTSHDDGEETYWNDDEIYTPVSDKRKIMMNSLMAAMKATCSNDSVAKCLAFNIESSLHQYIDSEKDYKGYRDKGYSLYCSLRKNEKLRGNLLHGDISFDEFVRLNTKELASEELQSLRKEMVATATLAKRTDIYQLARAEIARANNIDPNKGGEFRCGRCKSTNTVHNEKQTRSSDEPMTVFVCCLNCGKRWKF